MSDFTGGDHAKPFLAPVFIGVLAVMLLSIPHSPVVRAIGVPTWPQWAQNSQHTGFVNVAGQSLNRILADVIYDPLVPDEMAALGGDLLAHYQTPLVDGDDVFMESKSGNYNVNTYSSERWHQNRFTWQNGSLVRVWTFDSDWVRQVRVISGSPSIMRCWPTDSRDPAPAAPSSS
jgi:hypothetical protein